MRTFTEHINELAPTPPSGGGDDPEHIPQSSVEIWLFGTRHWSKVFGLGALEWKDDNDKRILVGWRGTYIKFDEAYRLYVTWYQHLWVGPSRGLMYVLCPREKFGAEVVKAGTGLGVSIDGNTIHGIGKAAHK